MPSVKAKTILVRLPSSPLPLPGRQSVTDRTSADGGIQNIRAKWSIRPPRKCDLLSLHHPPKCLFLLVRLAHSLSRIEAPSDLCLFQDPVAVHLFWRQIVGRPLVWPQRMNQPMTTTSLSHCANTHPSWLFGSQRRRRSSLCMEMLKFFWPLDLFRIPEKKGPIFFCGISSLLFYFSRVSYPEMDVIFIVARPSCPPPF